MDVPQLIYASIDGHLDCLCVLAVMNNAVASICDQVFVWICFSFSSKYLGVVLLGPVVTSCLTFLEHEFFFVNNFLAHIMISGEGPEILRSVFWVLRTVPRLKVNVYPYLFISIFFFIKMMSADEY